MGMIEFITVRTAETSVRLDRTCNNVMTGKEVKTAYLSVVLC